MATTAVKLGTSIQSSVERRNGVTWVALSGRFDEAVDFAPLMELPRPLTLDLSGVDRINSMGVRNWIDFVKKCETSGIELVFERCSPSIVSQISMITNFMGSRSRVKSIDVPYRCPACKSETVAVLELSPGAQIQRALPCPKCKAQMELDDLEEAYSSVISRLNA